MTHITLTGPRELSLTVDEKRRRDDLERKLNHLAGDIGGLTAKRGRLDSELRKLHIVYLKDEMEFSKLIGNPIDNRNLIAAMGSEERAYQERLRTGEW